MLNNMIKRAKSRKGDEGFTLIELLIVIIILGILAAVVVFSVNGLNDDSKTSACKAEVRTVETAYEAAVADGAASPTLASLQTAPTKFLRSAPEYVQGVTATVVTLKPGSPAGCASAPEVVIAP